MFKTVIWATDGSEAADEALDFAKRFASLEDAQLIALHANELFTARGGGFPLLADEADLQVKIMRQVEELRADGVDAKFRLVTSGQRNAARMIADFALDIGADAIVVGSRGHSAVTNLFLGSVAHRLLHLARCPVIVVPANVPVRVETAQQELVLN
jgi:nucleotide-binding universal stress UspA family protein